MIGTKNFWVNLALTFGFLTLMYIIYLALVDARIETRVAFWLGVATLLSTWMLTISNKRSDLKQKDLDSKAPTTMVIALDKKVDDHFQINQNTMSAHIADNRESMTALFDQQRQMIDLLIQTKDTNTKENKEIASKIEQVLKEARNEAKIEKNRDTKRTHKT